MWEAGCCDASEAALSTQGKCSAARSLPKQAKWLVMPEVVKLLVVVQEGGGSIMSVRGQVSARKAQPRLLEPQMVWSPSSSAAPGSGSAGQEAKASISRRKIEH